MTANQLLLLREIAGGKKTFRCVDQSVRKLEEFDRLADDLLRLKALGYVSGCEALKETTTGRGYVNRVHVRGGLTEEGRRALAGQA